MRSRVSKLDLSRPYFVEWGDYDGMEEIDYHCDYFVSRREAEDFVDDKKRLYAVWLGEIGTYQTDKGGSIRDWIYYWWNSATNWGELPFHKSVLEMTGYPAGAQRDPVIYAPFVARTDQR